MIRKNDADSVIIIIWFEKTTVLSCSWLRKTKFIFSVLQNLIVIKMLCTYNRREGYGLCSMEWSFWALNEFHFNILISFLMMLNIIFMLSQRPFLCKSFERKMKSFSKKNQPHTRNETVHFKKVNIGNLIKNSYIHWLCKLLLWIQSWYFT